MRRMSKMKLTPKMKLTDDSRILVSFYKPKRIVKTDHLFFKDIFPIHKSNTKKYNTKKRRNVEKKKTKLNLYLNNIDTCRSNPRMKQKDTMIKILKKLGKEHRAILDGIFRDFNLKNQSNIVKFVTKDIYSYSFEQCVEWMNLNGIELLRTIYILYLDRNLPSDIVELLGYYPQVRGEFTSLDIQNEIDIGLKKNQRVQIERNGIVLNLLIFSDDKIKIGDDFLNRCFYMDSLLKSVNLNRRNKINLEVWLSNKKKDLPAKRDMKYIGPKEVNSGCNTFSMEGNRVSVWRKEEFPKVLIHELVHSLGLEKHNDYKEVKEFIYNYFDVGRSNNLNVFECYVELMAEIVNLLLLNRSDFNRLINFELDHCLFQVGKILNYFGYSRWGQFYRKSGWMEQEKTGKYQQRSNVFSYFIFRAMVMYNMDDFINLCFNKNTRHFLKQDFESKELLIIVKKTLSDVNFEKKVNDYIKKNSLGDKKNIIFKNLRMTCVEGKLF